MERFRLGLGHVALDFVATVGARGGTPVERLDRVSTLDEWLVVSGAAHEGARSPRATNGQLATAHELREAIYRVLVAAREGRAPNRRDAQLVNSWARRPLPAPQLVQDLSLRIVGPDPVDGALAQIARETVELISGDSFHRVRRCDNCSLLFLDRSRPGRRRWCSMERCGNRAKTAKYRATHK